MMDIPVMLEATWNNLIGSLGKNVKETAEMTCEQVHQKIMSFGEKLSWVFSYNGFNLTQTNNLKNSSGTLHYVSSDKIGWISHRTKQRSRANWKGTSSRNEGDILREILDDVKAKGFTIKQTNMDHDTSGVNSACTFS